MSLTLCFGREKNGRRLNRQRGHTLIEVAIAMTIFSVGAMGMLRMMYGSAQITGTAGQMTQATALARAKLDDLVRMPYDKILTGKETKNLSAGGTIYKESGAEVGAYGATNGSYARSWTVKQTKADGSAGVGLKTVQVDVSWFENSLGMSRKISLVAAKGQ